MRPVRTLLLAAMLAVPGAAAAQAWQQAWQPEWNLRVRHERVDDDAFAQRADATTVRLRAGLRGHFGQGWEALLEAEAIATGGSFNDGGNGLVSRPAVIDPAGAEINQAWLRYAAGQVTVAAGRQRLLASDQRWLGNSGWRQNEQTFDAVALDWRRGPGMTARYWWLGRVHRINGDDALDALARERRLDSHYLELAWSGPDWSLAPYALLHRDRDMAAASTATWGVRGSLGKGGEGHGCRVAGSIARQRDHDGNPLSFSHDYWQLEPSCSVGAVTWRAGWEHLGGDGTHALQAPLGTLHAFNGWADKFNATPAGGLEDRYLGAGGKTAHGKLEWQLAWHDYRGDDRGARLGRELDASLVFPLARGLRGLLKIADYRADTHARDTRKGWLQLEWTP